MFDLIAEMGFESRALPPFPLVITASCTDHEQSPWRLLRRRQHGHGGPDCGDDSAYGFGRGGIASALGW